jgi:hypothetical protein
MRAKPHRDSQGRWRDASGRYIKAPKKLSRKASPKAQAAAHLKAQREQAEAEAIEQAEALRAKRRRSVARRKREKLAAEQAHEEKLAARREAAAHRKAQREQAEAEALEQAEAELTAIDLGLREIEEEEEEEAEEAEEEEAEEAEEEEAEEAEEPLPSPSEQASLFGVSLAEFLRASEIAVQANRPLQLDDFELARRNLIDELANKYGIAESRDTTPEDRENASFELRAQERARLAAESENREPTDSDLITARSEQLMEESLEELRLLRELLDTAEKRIAYEIEKSRLDPRTVAESIGESGKPLYAEFSDEFDIDAREIYRMFLYSPANRLELIAA